MDKFSAKKAFFTTIPVMSGYLALGTGFGILLASKGYSAIWAFIMAVTMYAGAMQYVAVDLLATGASLISVAITTLLVNARHLFYGISLIDKYKDLGKRKFYMMFALTDETYSLICGHTVPEGVNLKSYYFFISLFNQCYWIIGCTVGAIIGSLVDFNPAGIDFVLTALFIVIFLEQWQTKKGRLPAIIGVASTIACLLIFGSENFLIPAMLTIATILTIMRRRLEINE